MVSKNEDILMNAPENVGGITLDYIRYIEKQNQELKEENLKLKEWLAESCSCKGD